MPSPIVVYGSETCEDTALVRSRLAATGVPFRYVDIDRDAAAADRVVAANGGHRVTPTVVVGGGSGDPLGSDALVAAEPTLERLTEIVVAGGHDPSVIDATRFYGELIERSIPSVTLPMVDGGSFSVVKLRGKRQAALFLAHDAGCLPCFGYARQLTSRQAELAGPDSDAEVVIAIPDRAAAAEEWRHGIDQETSLVVDDGGGWKQAVTAAVGVSASAAVVLALDRFGAPRAGLAAHEAGGLPDPSAMAGWLRFVALDCPECSGELPWPV